MHNLTIRRVNDIEQKIKHNTTVNLNDDNKSREFMIFLNLKIVL